MPGNLLTFSLVLLVSIGMLPLPAAAQQVQKVELGKDDFADTLTSLSKYTHSPRAEVLNTLGTKYQQSADCGPVYFDSARSGLALSESDELNPVCKHHVNNTHLALLHLMHLFMKDIRSSYFEKVVLPDFQQACAKILSSDCETDNLKEEFLHNPIFAGFFISLLVSSRSSCPIASATRPWILEINAWLSEYYSGNVVPVGFESMLANLDALDIEFTLAANFNDVVSCGFFKLLGKLLNSWEQ